MRQPLTIGRPCRIILGSSHHHVRGQMKRRLVVLAGLLALAALLFGISGIPRFKNGHGLDGVIGGIGWFGGLLCALAFIVYGVRTIIVYRKERQHPETTAIAP